MLVKAEAKKASRTSAFSLSCVDRSLISFSSGWTFSLAFLLSFVYLQKPFLSPLTSLARFCCGGALAFLNTSLHDWTTSLYSSQVTFPLPKHAYLLHVLFLCLSFPSSVLFIHVGLLTFLCDFLLSRIGLGGGDP